jgi:hypothetical protein
MAPLPNDAVERPVSRGRVVVKPTRPLPDHPDVQVEAMIENGFVDIVVGRIDARICPSEQVEPDMIAVRIGLELRGDAALP